MKAIVFLIFLILTDLSSQAQPLEAKIYFTLTKNNDTSSINPDLINIYALSNDTIKVNILKKENYYIISKFSDSIRFSVSFSDWQFLTPKYSFERLTSYKVINFNLLSRKHAIKYLKKNDRNRERYLNWRKLTKGILITIEGRGHGLTPYAEIFQYNENNR